MNSQQTLTAAGGAGLVVANFWTQQRSAVTAGIFNSSAKAGQTQTAHSTLTKIGAELLFVGILTILAGTSPAAGNAVVAVIIGLALLWMVRYNSAKTKTN